MIVTTAGSVWVRVGIASNCYAMQRIRTQQARALPVNALQVLGAAFAMRRRGHTVLLPQRQGAQPSGA